MPIQKAVPIIQVIIRLLPQNMGNETCPVIGDQCVALAHTKCTSCVIDHPNSKIGIIPALCNRLSEPLIDKVSMTTIATLRYGWNLLLPDLDVLSVVTESRFLNVALAREPVIHVGGKKVRVAGI